MGLIAFGFLLSIGCHFILPLVNGLGRKGLASKLERQEEIEAASKGILIQILRKVPSATGEFILLCVGLMYASVLLGYGDAKNQKAFLVPVSDPDKVYFVTMATQ